MADNQVEVSTEINADAGTLYDMVADLANMGQWSPEATGVAGSVAGGPRSARSSSVATAADGAAG